MEQRVLLAQRNGGSKP